MELLLLSSADPGTFQSWCCSEISLVAQNFVAVLLLQLTCNRPRCWDMLTHLQISCKTKKEAPGHLQRGGGLAAPLGEEGKPPSPHSSCSFRAFFWFSELDPLPTDTAYVCLMDTVKRRPLSTVEPKTKILQTGPKKMVFIFVPDCKEACMWRGRNCPCCFSGQSDHFVSQKLWRRRTGSVEKAISLQGVELQVDFWRYCR